MLFKPQNSWKTINKNLQIAKKAIPVLIILFVKFFFEML